MHRKKLGSAIWASKEVVEREMCIGGGCGARIVHRRKLRSVNCALWGANCASEEVAERELCIRGSGGARMCGGGPRAAPGDTDRHRRRHRGRRHRHQGRCGGRTGPPLGTATRGGAGGRAPSSTAVREARIQSSKAGRRTERPPPDVATWGDAEGSAPPSTAARGARTLL